MAGADRLAMAGGVPGVALMEAAGAGVAAAIEAGWSSRSVLVLCGPGNNGGDGFVVARRLAAAGWPVRLALLGRREALRGDAAVVAAGWPGPIEPLASLPDGGGLAGEPLVVDALFGAGLSRPLEGAVRTVIEAVTARRLPVVAVDVPSGVDGDTGQVMGAAPMAALTVTFFRRKPGHLLLPGRRYCGRVEVVDIGIPAAVLEQIRPAATANHPGLWLPLWPQPRPDGHKYQRGHALITGGGRMTGAARLAARAALRVGAGLVTVACPPEAELIYSLAAAALLVEAVTDSAAFRTLLGTGRRNAVLLGPGNGVSAALRERVLAALASGLPAVLDADALTAFAAAPELLFAALSDRCLLTPHEGEFTRLFAAEAGLTGKTARARAAAARSGAVVLLKGADTVIAAPDGRVVINEGAPPDLATAGSGDVLAGFAVGLIAQGLPAFEAAAAAAWLHGETAARLGPGLIADDLPEALPALLAGLRQRG
ncbi:MAG: NAD(P)H-hydrate dehydratase [Rhodospirillaceae bacterium]